LFLLRNSLKFIIEKKKVKIFFFLNSKNSCETFIGYTFCIGYTLCANCSVPKLFSYSCWIRDHNMVLKRTCNLTAFIHSSTGPEVYPFASRHKGPGFNHQLDIYVKPGFFC
jgi:hypothetical protein